MAHGDERGMMLLAALRDLRMTFTQIGVMAPEAITLKNPREGDRWLGLLGQVFPDTLFQPSIVGDNFELSVVGIRIVWPRTEKLT